MSDAIFGAGGYSEQGGAFVASPSDTDAPQYVDVRVGGLKQQDFLRAINGFGHTNDTVILYIGPIAPCWRTELQSTNATAVEDNFRHVVEEAIAPYPNIHFIDFSANDIPTLPNIDFSDVVHLNYTGARVFTSLLAAKLQALGVIKGN